MKRIVEVNVRGWLVVALFFGVALLGVWAATKRSDWQSAWWTVGLPVGLGGLALLLIARDRYGRVTFEVDDGALKVTTRPAFRKSALVLRRESIDGFWVCGPPEEGGGPPLFVSLMVDERATKTCALMTRISEPKPAIVLAELLAKRLGVTADTRAGEFD